ncbi:HEAT repeat domain-containing protein [Gimesia aquarii]|uniref:Tetratricopeptide repeat protein n=1 Tax=Gimesia aquarii TaxID=2527964 RepID=A0A517WTN4_9PLAN|nr:HEAT repeat domain-containing protein [Gimesia aquarii]QDU08620.1 Tetratricopeptide repeat protein [Gimesia aquarii]
MKRCSIWAAVLSASVAVPFAGCSHMPTAMLPSSAKEKVLDSKMVVAQDLESKKEFEKAKKAYELIHKADPKHARACHRLAIVSYRLGDREKALEYFKKGQELTPENPELLSDYGYALYKMKQYEEAEGILKKSVKLDPKSERAITRLATVYGIQGKMKESYTELRKISGPAEAHEIVAHLHSQRGEKQLALSHYQKSLAISKREASGRGDLKKGSKAYELNQELLKRVEQNVAHLSSDPTLKSAQSKMQMVNHSQQKKRELTASGREKDLFRKPVEKTFNKTTKKKQAPEIEIAETKNSPFRVIRERIVKPKAKQKVENPFLADPKLAESAFEKPEMEVAEKKQDTKTKAEQQIAELDQLLARTKPRPEVKEEVTFRRLTDEDVQKVERSLKAEKQTAQVTRDIQVARDETKPVKKNVKQKRSAFELMRELQYELIADFTPPEEELVIEEQPEFQLVERTEPQTDFIPQREVENPFVNQTRQMAVQSPFEGRTVQLGKWKPIEPGMKAPEKTQVSTVSRQVEVQPVLKSKKTFVQNAIVSRPKPETAQPMTAVDMCPAATGEVLKLVKQLDAYDVPTLKQAVQRLGAMESEAIAATPALRSLTLHENMGVRIQCAFSLWKIEGNTDDSIPTLIEAMNSFVESDRSFAAAVLSQMGTQSQELTPILVRSLSDTNEYVRLHTAELLARNPEWQSQANKTLADCVVSKDVNIRWLATYSLADLKSQDDRVVAALSIALQDKASQVRAGAAYALGEIGPYAHKSIPELQKARFDTNSEVRVAAKNALSRVRRVSPPAAN